MREIATRIGVAALLAGALAGPSAESAADEDPEDASLIQLIASPARFHGKAIRAKGYCHFEFEGNALYLHRDDYERAIRKNAVWLDVGWPVPKERQSLSDDYVLVEGTFDADCRGHLGAYSGCIKGVSRVERLHRSNERELVPPPPPVK